MHTHANITRTWCRPKQNFLGDSATLILARHAASLPLAFGWSLVYRRCRKINTNIWHHTHSTCGKNIKIVSIEEKERAITLWPTVKKGQVFKNQIMFHLRVNTSHEGCENMFCFHLQVIQNLWHQPSAGSCPKVTVLSNVGAKCVLAQQILLVRGAINA